jgi:hypothetical protein
MEHTEGTKRIDNAVRNSRTESKDWLYNAVHDMIQGLYDGTKDWEERRKILGDAGYESFKELDYWLGHA